MSVFKLVSNSHYENLESRQTNGMHKDDPWRAGCKQTLQELQARSALSRIDTNSQVERRDVENKRRQIDVLVRGGRFEHARVLEEERLLVLIALHGTENEQTVDSLETLSSILFSMGQNDRADKLLDAVIALQCKTQGEKHRSALASVASKVGQLHLLGRTSKAELLGSKLVEICKESLPPDDAATLRAISNLASIYTSKGDYANAEKLRNEVLQVRERTLPYDDIDTVRSMVKPLRDLLWPGSLARCEFSPRIRSHHQAAQSGTNTH
jgi:hypothetical protein